MTTTIHAMYGYRDAPAALEWLGTVFGFEPTAVVPDDEGGIAHSELRVGEAAIVVFSDRDGYGRPPRKGPTCGFSTYLAVDDPAEIDATHERALAGGATEVWKPETSEWGNHRCRFHDPEGYEWTLGVHRPGLANDWG